MDWISVKKELPKITDEKSFVTVKVRTKHNGIGEMTFGYSGAMGEPMTGSFWHPIRNFSGEVHLDNDIIDWMPLDEYPRDGKPADLKSGNCNLADVSKSEYCMPDNVNTKEEHEQYLIDIGITDVVGKSVRIKPGATQRLIENGMWFNDWKFGIDNQIGEIINDYRMMPIPHYEVRIGKWDIGIMCEDMHFC